MLLVLLGKLGDTKDCEGPERNDDTTLTLKYSYRIQNTEMQKH